MVRMGNTIRQTHGRRPLPSILNRQSSIVNEFQEPLREVVAGFIPMGMTIPSTAETLGVDPRSLRKFCNQANIRFPVNQPDRVERIRHTKRRAAPKLALGRTRQSVAEWAEQCGISRYTLHKRLQRGWSLSDAIRL